MKIPKQEKNASAVYGVRYRTSHTADGYGRPHTAPGGKRDGTTKSDDKGKEAKKKKIFSLTY